MRDSFINEGSNLDKRGLLIIAFGCELIVYKGVLLLSTLFRNILTFTIIKFWNKQ